MVTTVTPAPLIDPDEITGPLTMADRCDGCGARAFVRALVPSGDSFTGPLLFCAHHYHVHEPKLTELGAAIDDYRVKPKPFA
jgi:hypothetical protein